MKIYRNNCGKEIEVKRLPSNMEKGLKNKKTWVSTYLIGEYVAFTERNYEALCRAAQRGRPIYKSNRAFTIQVLNDNRVFLEGSASNQYILQFKSEDEKQKWIHRYIKMIDSEITLG